MIVGYVSDKRYIAVHDVSVLFDAGGSAGVPQLQEISK